MGEHSSESFIGRGTITRSLTFSDAQVTLITSYTVNLGQPSLHFGYGAKVPNIIANVFNIEISDKRIQELSNSQLWNINLKVLHN